MLITIIVLCYNSESTIVETLNSIKEQTYKNIELIINDDCSSDGSTALIKGWILDNQFRFTNIVFIENEINIGTVKSINNCLKKSQGEYTKIFSADDILLSSAISRYIKHANDFPDVDIWFGKYDSFGYRKTSYGENVKNFTKFKTNKKIRLSKELNYVGSSIAMLVKNPTVAEINYFDEDYILLEDKPFYLKCIKNGLKMGYIDEVLVHYRIHESVSHSGEKYINEKILLDHITFYNKEISSDKNILLKLHYLKDIYKAKIIIHYGNKKKLGRAFFLLDLFDIYFYKVLFNKLRHIFRTKIKGGKYE